MYLAMCMDGGMLLSFLLFRVIVGIICGTPLVLGVVALVNWLGARRKRMAVDLR